MKHFPLLAMVVGCASVGDPVFEDTETPIVAGAGYTTFDVGLGGCKNSQNGVNCNSYVDKSKVFMSGGPAKAGVSDGEYYFAVLTPGSQLDGFIDGNPGNLSLDPSSNRTFTEGAHEIVSYAGNHVTGVAPNGRGIIGLAPFADTDNPGGVYVLAICRTGALSPDECKYDAFRIFEGDKATQPVFPIINGAKYYDANLNGRRDDGEPGIAGWLIDYHDMVSGTVATGADGTFSQVLIPDEYQFDERDATNMVALRSGATTLWHQTGNTVDQTTVTGNATARLDADRTYWVTVTDDSTASGLYFGNVCIGRGGGLTLGFWSNKNGQALYDAGDQAALVAFNLRNGSGAHFDPTSYTKFRSWLLSATATNMAYMLSAQMAASIMNVRNGKVGSYAQIFAPGTASADTNGFATITAVIAEANLSLATNGFTVAAGATRSYQEALKNALDNANNDLNFVQATPATCATPSF